MSPPITGRLPARAFARKSRQLALPIIISITLHGFIWRICQVLEPIPEKPQELVIQATLVSPPKSAQLPVPPTIAEKRPESALPKPVLKKPEKPKVIAKPKPIAPSPVAKPQPAEAPEMKSEAVQAPVPQTVAPPVAAPPAPEPLTEATEIGGTLRNIAKHYPATALQRGWEGKVVLEVQILANGTTGYVKVLQGTGHDLLDEAAVEAIKEAPWVPAKRGTKPVDSIRKLPIIFKINKQDHQ
jgi:protein TonB